MNQYVINTLKSFFKSNQIVIEITENGDIEDFEKNEAIYTRCKNTGVQITIDDFDSGYTNYFHVSELKPNCIKIDGTFIKDLTTNKENQIFCKKYHKALRRV